jgi:hypothetical protein
MCYACTRDETTELVVIVKKVLPEAMARRGSTGMKQCANLSESLHASQ